MTRCTCFTETRCAIHGKTDRPGFGKRRAPLERKSTTRSAADGYDGAAFRRAVIGEVGAIDWIARNAIAATDRQRELVADALKYEQRATLQGCHLIPKRWLRDNYSAFTTDRPLADILGDPRNGVPGSPDLHDLFDRGVLHVPVSRFPAAVFDFERELGGPAYIDEYYGRRRGPIGVVS